MSKVKQARIRRENALQVIINRARRAATLGAAVVLIGLALGSYWAVFLGFVIFAQACKSYYRNSGKQTGKSKRRS